VFALFCSCPLRLSVFLDSGQSSSLHLLPYAVIHFIFCAARVCLFPIYIDRANRLTCLCAQQTQSECMDVALCGWCFQYWFLDHKIGAGPVVCHAVFEGEHQQCSFHCIALSCLQLNQLPIFEHRTFPHLLGGLPRGRSKKCLSGKASKSMPRNRNEMILPLPSCQKIQLPSLPSVTHPAWKFWDGGREKLHQN